MFKRENSSEELFKSMKQNIVKNANEKEFKFEKLAQALNLLEQVSVSLDNQNLLEESNDVLNIIESLESR
jgi:hypothetical protein